jgi:hypothetical protein
MAQGMIMCAICPQQRLALVTAIAQHWHLMNVLQAALQPMPGLQAALQPKPGLQALPEGLAALETTPGVQVTIQPGEQAPDTATAKPSPGTSAVVNMLATVSWRMPLVVFILFMPSVMPSMISYITGNRITADFVCAAQNMVLCGMVAAWTRPISTRQGLWGLSCKLVLYISTWLTGWSLLNVVEATGISVMVGLYLARLVMISGTLAALTLPSETSRQSASSRQGGAWGMAYKFVMWFINSLTAGILVMTVFCLLRWH